MSERTFAITGLTDAQSGFYTNGLLTFISGSNSGQKTEVRRHSVDGALVIIELWQAPPVLVSVGDECLIKAGCDKYFSTCREKFANAANFRGFPHMPGNDFLASVAKSGQG